MSNHADDNATLAPTDTEYKTIKKSASTESEESDTEDPNHLPNRKVIIIGDSETGKTSLLIRFDQDRYCDGGLSATVGIGYVNKIVNIEDSRVKLQIWDTAGQERFRSITRAYYRDAEAMLLVYDITNRKSYDNIKSWITEIHELAKEDVIIMLIGNKADLQSHRQVSQEEGQKIAQENSAIFAETSAKLGENVEYAFVTLARELQNLSALHPSSEERHSVAHLSKHKTKASKCC